jgi:endonuclease YncB( thermonuclease family)
MRWLLILLVLVAQDALAQALSGRVVKISDGDTLTVLDAGKTQHRIRLAGVDAPELGQAFGRRAKQSLVEICAAREAQVETQGKDRYSRTIGRVYCAGVDASGEQVRRGMAWVFVKYAPKDSPLYVLEKDARLRRVGLWTDRRPIAPWEWRRTKDRGELEKR